MTRRSYALRDDTWEGIKELFPGINSYVLETVKDSQLFMEAVSYRFRVGIPWRDLPEGFGNFQFAHTSFTQLSKWALAKSI